MYDWRIISANTYIDINSINLTEYGSVYEYWVKTYHDRNQTMGNIVKKYGTDICLMVKYYINIRTRKAATAAGIIYNYDCNKIYENYELPFESLEWESVPPGANSAIALDIIKGTYTPPSLTVLNPIISTLLSVIIGLILTYILGLFYLIDRENPLLFFTVITYTIHPFIRYALNIGIAHLYGHSFWRRFIISAITFSLINNVLISASNNALKESYKNAVEYCKNSTSSLENNNCVKNYIYNNSNGNYYKYDKIWNYCFQDDSKPMAEKSTCVGNLIEKL